MGSMEYVKAPAGWLYTDRNPFTRDGFYGLEWSAFCVLEKEDDGFVTGRGANGLFAARFGRRVQHLENRLVDFLRYESAYARTVILSLPHDLDVDGFIAQALSRTPKASIVRPHDAQIVVHSTTLSAWRSICVDGELKAASLLAGRRREPPGSGEPDEVEQYMRDEPPEYGDYIMFGALDSTAPEMVVASYSAGHFVLEDGAVYEPGVRLYFDNHRIIQDSLGARDGLHMMKVHRQLPLTPYLLAAISVDDIDPTGTTEKWTIRAFVERANEVLRTRSGLRS